MLEILWACLLILSVFNREARPLALLMAANWLANYWYFENVSQWSPAIIDTLFAVPAVVLASNIRDWRNPVLSAAFVLNPVVHGWFWMLYDAGVYVGVQYYWFVVGLFSLKVIALSGPGMMNVVACLRCMVRHMWRRMDSGHVAACQKQGPRETRGISVDKGRGGYDVRRSGGGDVSAHRTGARA